MEHLWETKQEDQERIRELSMYVEHGFIMRLMPEKAAGASPRNTLYGVRSGIQRGG